jgi:hypothetical protein
VSESAEIDASKLTMTETVERHISEVTTKGELARPYGASTLVVKSIMEAVKPVPDPGGLVGGLRWDAPGAFNGTAGTWELVVDTLQMRIVHFRFGG